MWLHVNIYEAVVQNRGVLGGSRELICVIFSSYPFPCAIVGLYGLFPSRSEGFSSSLAIEKKSVARK